MPEMSLKEIYPTPWGIVEQRRHEIESGSYGAFERIMREELEKVFIPITRVAELMKACESTARRWLKENDPRFIVQDDVIFYHREDAMAVIEHRKQTKIKKQKEPA